MPTTADLLRIIALSCLCFCCSTLAISTHQAGQSEAQQRIESRLESPEPLPLDTCVPVTAIGLYGHQTFCFHKLFCNERTQCDPHSVIGDSCKLGLFCLPQNLSDTAQTKLKDERTYWCVERGASIRAPCSTDDECSASMSGEMSCSPFLVIKCSGVHFCSSEAPLTYLLTAFTAKGVCINSVCTAQLPFEAACSSNRQCASGYCDIGTGKCSGKAFGTPCVPSRNTCGKGLICAPMTPEEQEEMGGITHTCQPGDGEGERCTVFDSGVYSSSCKGGLVCSDSQTSDSEGSATAAQPKCIVAFSLPMGSPCSAPNALPDYRPSDCEFGSICLDGVCRASTEKTCTATTNGNSSAQGIVTKSSCNTRYEYCSCQNGSLNINGTLYGVCTPYLNTDCAEEMKAKWQCIAQHSCPDEGPGLEACVNDYCFFENLTASCCLRRDHELLFAGSISRMCAFPWIYKPWLPAVLSIGGVLLITLVISIPAVLCRKSRSDKKRYPTAVDFQNYGSTVGGSYPSYKKRRYRKVN